MEHVDANVATAVSFFGLGGNILSEDSLETRFLCSKLLRIRRIFLMVFRISGIFFTINKLKVRIVMYCERVKVLVTSCEALKS